MDVTCERCQTRYEFDEALVSARGTTVRCTCCGHSFRVHRPAGSGGFESWTVRTQAGWELQFRAMRELQAAISSGRVGRDDVLLAGAAEPRRLGAIAELQGFFPEIRGMRAATDPLGSRPPISGVQTGSAGSVSIRMELRDVGLPRGAAQSAPPPLPGPPAPPAEAEPEDPFEAATVMRSPDEVGPRARPFGPPLEVPVPAHQRAHAALGRRERDPDEGYAPRNSVTAVRMQPPVRPREDDTTTRDAMEALGRAVSNLIGDEERERGPTGSPLDDEETLAESDETTERARRRGPVAPPPPPQPVRITGSGPPLTPSPSLVRPSILRRSDPYSEPRFSGLAVSSRRPALLRWVVGLLCLGALGVVGFTLAARYGRSAPGGAASAQPDARVDRFLQECEQCLDGGDLECAAEQIAKASGVSPEEPRVVLGAARVGIIQADLVWLHLKLLKDDDPKREALRRELALLAGQAEKAIEHTSPKDPAGVRLRINLLRLKGNGEAARRLVRELGPAGPDDALLLAALDLGEPSPSWSSVAERLRAAVRAEKKLGRARAMLVYALGRAGSGEEASRELELLSEGGHTHPLAEPLEAFLEAAGAVAAADAKDRTGDRADAGQARADDAGAAAPKDFREALRLARAARQSGNMERAEQLYQAALETRPGNSEALGGLAEVARARGDTAGAMRAYESMLRSNPGYVPAVIGLADLKWQSGDRAGATALYQQAIESAPGSSFAKHAQARLEGASPAHPAAAETAKPSAPTPTAAPTAAPSATAPAPKPAPTAQPTAPSAAPPGVDVSDLPEFH